MTTPFRSAKEIKNETLSAFLRHYQLDVFPYEAGSRLFQEALHTRIQVFVEQAGFPLSEEPDAKDARSTHYLVRTLDTRKAIASLRCTPVEGLSGCWELSRIAVLPQYQEQDIGKYLVQHVTQTLQKQHQATEVRLSTPERSLVFFESLGFVPYGKPHQEYGTLWLPLHLYLKKR